MSAKKEKAIRKKIRKEVRVNMGEGIEALSNMIRKKPRLVPKAIWILLYLPIFKRKYIKFIYKYM